MTPEAEQGQKASLAISAEQWRETLAEYFFNREADLAKEDDEKHGHAAQEYAHWPKDAAVQPYCRWAYREADAFLQSDIAAALTAGKDKRLAELEAELARLREQVHRENASGRLEQFLRMKKERPIDSVYWDMHEENNLRAALEPTPQSGQEGSRFLLVLVQSDIAAALTAGKDKRLAELEAELARIRELLKEASELRQTPQSGQEGKP